MEGSKLVARLTRKSGASARLLLITIADFRKHIVIDMLQCIGCSKFQYGARQVSAYITNGATCSLQRRTQTFQRHAGHQPGIKASID